MPKTKTGSKGKAKSKAANGEAGGSQGPEVKKPRGRPKKEAPAELEALRAKAAEAKQALIVASNEASALRLQGMGVEAAAKKTYIEALGPYRGACRKAGVACEFGGARAANKTPAVRFLVEKVAGGIKVAIKDRPETEEVIAKKALEESIGKAAFGYTDRWLGTREEIGAKGAGLSNRLRAVLAKS